MNNIERKKALYKQECVNTRFDLCGLETDILEAAQSALIDLHIANKLLKKVKTMIEGINEIFPRIERI